MKLLIFAALATLATPALNFTEDSVYVKDNILEVEFIEEYDGTHTLKMSENNIPGYTIFDDEETPYIDGILIDGVPASDWSIHQFDTSVEHDITVKTVYTTDIFGALVSAKDGDWSLLLQNPLMYIQIFYYIINTLATVIGGTALIKYKKLVKKLKEDLANSVNEKIEALDSNLVKVIDTVLNEIVSKNYKEISSQYQNIIKALVLAHSNTNEDTLALMDLLNKTSTEDISSFVNSVKEKYTTLINKKKDIKEQAIKTIKTVKKISESKPTIVDDGTSI